MNDLKIKTDRAGAHRFLIFASFFLYILLTASKTLYTAEKTTLYELGTFGNLTDLATTMEYYFYTYTAMQILLVFFVKKINVKWFLTVTVGASSVLTMLMPATDGIMGHYVIFTVNGFLQAGIWGILLKILSAHLPAGLLPTANQIMSAGPAVSGAMAYAVAAAFGEDWKTPFFVMGALLAFAVVLYCISVTRVEKIAENTNEISPLVSPQALDEEDNDFIHLDTKARVVWFFVIAMVMGFLFTSLYFMLNNSLDVYLKEIGGFSNSAAKLLTILAPICAVVGPFMTVYSCEKHRNFIAVAGVYFGIALLFSILLVIFFDKSVIASLIFIVLFIVFVNGGRSVTLSIASLRMRKKIDAGVFSTAVNATSSIASGLSPKIITRILDNADYTTIESWRISFLVIVLWTMSVTVLSVLLVLLVKLINRNREKERIPVAVK